MSDPVPEREAPDWFQPERYDPNCCNPLWDCQIPNREDFITEGHEAEDRALIQEYIDGGDDLPDHLKAYGFALDEYHRKCERWRQEKAMKREAKWVHELRKAVDEAY